MEAPPAVHRDVEQVLLRYCRAIDEKDWDLFASCFTDDCRTRYQGREFEGLTRLTDVMRRLHDPLDASLHRLTNVEVTVEGDLAQARSYVDALLVRTGHPAGALHQVAGRYSDELVRVDGAWLIRARVFDAVWVSERGSLPVPAPGTLEHLLQVPPSSPVEGT